MTNKLRDELAAVVRVELNQEALDAIDGEQKTQRIEDSIANRIIDHLAPTISEADYGLRIAKRDIRNWYTSKEAADATIKVIDRSLASLSEWKEKGE